MLICPKGDAVAAAKKTVAPFTPLITATVAVVEQSDSGMEMKQGVDTFFQGMPYLMKGLNELKTLHPFVGGTLIHNTCLFEFYLVSSRGSGIRNGLYAREEAPRE